MLDQLDYQMIIEEKKKIKQNNSGTNVPNAPRRATHMNTNDDTVPLNFYEPNYQPGVSNYYAQAYQNDNYMLLGDNLDNDDEEYLGNN